MVEFANAQDIQWQGNVGTVRHGTDDSVWVKFYKDAATGEDFIHMRFPGDKCYSPRRKVKDSDKMRWPRQWDAYKNNKNQFEGQTMLEELAWIDEGTREEFHAKGVYTLEGLAGVADANLSGLGHGGRDFRNRAQKELEAKQKAAAFDEQNAKLADMQHQIEALQAQLASQPKKRGPGRPRKEEKTDEAEFIPE